MTVIPRAYLYAGAAVLMSSIVVAHLVDDARELKRVDHAARVFVRDSISGAASNTLRVEVETLTVVKERVNTVIRMIAAKADTVTQLVERIPDTVRVNFPIVDSLAVEARKLALLVPVLRDSLISERRSVDALRIAWGQVMVSVRDSLRVEQARPKRTVGGTLARVGIAAAAGLVVGRWTK